jgi:hypothetical protein
VIADLHSGLTRCRGHGADHLVPLRAGPGDADGGDGGRGRGAETGYPDEVGAGAGSGRKDGVTTVVFDKTGTLTSVEPEVASKSSSRTARFTRSDLLQLGASVEAASRASHRPRDRAMPRTGWPIFEMRPVADFRTRCAGEGVTASSMARREVEVRRDERATLPRGDRRRTGRHDSPCPTRCAVDASQAAIGHAAPTWCRRAHALRRSARGGAETYRQGARAPAVGDRVEATPESKQEYVRSLPDGQRGDGGRRHQRRRRAGASRSRHRDGLGNEHRHRVGRGHRAGRTGGRRFPRRSRSPARRCGRSSRICSSPSRTTWWRFPRRRSGCSGAQGPLIAAIAMAMLGSHGRGNAVRLKGILKASAGRLRGSLLNTPSDQGPESDVREAFHGDRPARTSYQMHLIPRRAAGNGQSRRVAARWKDDACGRHRRCSNRSWKTADDPQDATLATMIPEARP